MPDDETQTQPKKRSPATDFLILKAATPDLKVWNVIGKQSAHNSDQALRRHFVKQTGTDEEAGVFVAVSSRSFKPQERRVKTETRVTYGDALPSTTITEPPVGGENS
jgi:hypothetical protein